MTPKQQLQQLYHEANRQKYPSFPDNLRPSKAIKTTTANGLTKAVVDFLNLSGHFATRINNTGTWVKEKAHVNGGYYRPSTQVKGIADINATINGRTVAIEVKIGRDRQSDAQRAYQDRIERSGGTYWIVKDFDQFYELYNNFINDKKD
jgi:ribosomal 50S subunit-recycling heat shock protein